MLGLSSAAWGSFFKSVSLSHILPAIVIGGAVLIIYFFFKYAFTRRSLSKQIPCKSYGLFDILGVLSEVEQYKKVTKNFNCALLEVMKNHTKEFGKHKLFLFWISYCPLLMAVKAGSAEALISGTKNLKKSWNYIFLEPWLGTGLLTSFGKKWKSRRKLLTPSFHFEILKEFLPVFNEQSQTLVKILKKESHRDFIDIVMPITLCTLDIICETTLGVKIDTQENQHSEYVQAVLGLANILAERTMNGKHWFDVIFKRTENGRNQKKYIKLLHDFTRKVIHDKKQQILSGDLEAFSKKKRKALMDVLLEHHIRTKELTEEDIREEVDTFTFEGHDTTSMGICWALYLIGLHKDIQENIHQELDRIFGDDTERPATTDDLKDMEYLERVLKESQRLYPSVPFFAREASEDLVIDGYKIPKGTICAIITYMIHRDEAVFPDPEKFDPDRFLPENTVNRHPFAYIPFSAGPRNCIGQRFAMMEEKVVVSSVLRNFHLHSLDPRDKITTAAELILRALEPIRIKFTPRHTS